MEGSWRPFRRFQNITRLTQTGPGIHCMKENRLWLVFLSLIVGRPWTITDRSLIEQGHDVGLHGRNDQRCRDACAAALAQRMSSQVTPPPPLAEERCRGSKRRI